MSYSHYINSNLDAPLRILSFAVDEIVLPMTIFFISFFINHIFIGSAIAISCLIGIKHMKKKQGDAFIFSFIYRYTPRPLVASILKQTPAFEQQAWLR